MDVATSNVDFRAALALLAENRLGKTLMDAQAFADAGLKRYWNWFTLEIDQQRRRGIVPYFSTVGGGTNAFSHTANSLLSSSDENDQFRGRLATSRPDILRQLDQLNDRQYEAMACIACKAIGARVQVLTPPGNEGGIDFIASLPLRNSSHIFSSTGSDIRIVGQCKKYQSPAAVDRVENFLHTMNNVRHRSERVRKHLPHWFEEERGPIIGWIVSHMGYQTGAADEAKRHGIILSDTLDMAELFSFSTTFYASDPPSKRAKRIYDDCQSLLR